MRTIPISRKKHFAYYGGHMEIKRKIYDKILNWKQTCNGSKALLIEGARRIGKSTVAEEIGKNEYKSYILIDFNKASKKILDSFDDLTNLDIFFQTVSLEYNKRLYPRAEGMLKEVSQKKTNTVRSHLHVEFNFHL